MPIRKFGNEEQKKKYLVPLAEGTKHGFRLTEPVRGSDVCNCKAELDGSGY